MRLNFRQGIVKYQTDENGTPQYLDFSVSRGTVGIVVAESPVLVSFAHRDANYLMEETIRIADAWGPLPNETCWLFWDISLQNAQVTRGYTLIKPSDEIVVPSTPLENQHWFDHAETVMKVWDGVKWGEKIRVFAGVYHNGRVDPMQIGSQVGIEHVNDAGYLLLDPFQMPLRYKPAGEPPSWYSRFLTTESWITVANRGSMLSKIDSGNFPVIANEPIPKFSLVQMKPGRKVELARHTDHTTRVNGIIVEDMYRSDISDLFCHGFIANDDWNWADEYINKPLYCGAHGELSLNYPRSGVYQQVGYIYDRNAIFIDLMPVLILDQIQSFDYDKTIVVPPVADFMVDVVEGDAPLTVTFTSSTLDAVNWEWDFQNNDSWDGAGKVKKFMYQNPGTYTVRHRVSNYYGTDTKIVANLIKVREPETAVLKPNLKSKLSAVGLVKTGVTFKIRLMVENVGLGHALDFSKKIMVRADTGVDIIVVNASGGMVSKVGAGSAVNPKIVSITFNSNSLNSMQQSVVEVELKVGSYARNIVVTGLVTAVDDSYEGDNEIKLQLPVKS